MLLMSIFLLFSCSDKMNMYDTTIFALDTVITIKISNNREVLSDCSQMITDYENIFSRTIPTSDIAQFKENVSESAIELIAKSIDIADKTNGNFNPALGTVTPLWHDSIPDIVDLSHTDYTKISITDNKLSKSDSELQLDLGGIAKGYICEKVTDYLIAQGVYYGVLSFGGNISVFGDRTWDIGIRSPYDTDDIVGNLHIDSGYVSVSGDYQRYFEADGKRYHHIIDPATGYPTDNGVNSVVVWCDDGTLADALSTALFVMGVDDGMKYHDSDIYDFEVMYITQDGLIMSDGFRQHFTEKAT